MENETKNKEQTTDSSTKKLLLSDVINSVCQICGEPLDDDNIYGKCTKCYFDELEAN